MIVLRWIFWALLRLVLAGRYRVRMHGWEQLREVKGSILLMPNHPAYIDPFIIFALFWPWSRMRPLVYAGNFQGVFGRFASKLFNALEVPYFEVANAQARAETEQMVQIVSEGIRQGWSFALWPSGHVTLDGSERLGAARSAADILQEAPDVTVVLVRTRGLYGSSWSYAQTGRRPNLARRFLAGLGTLLANLLFFTPRRHVEMTIRVVPRGERPEPRREVLNPWLEEWYNRDINGGPERAIFVPYHFLFGHRTFDFPPPPKDAEFDLKNVLPQSCEAVIAMLAEHLKRPLNENEKQPDTRLEQLGLDSLDRMEMALEVERKFGFSGDETPATIGGLLALAHGIVQKKPPPPPPPAWFRPLTDTGSLKLLGETIPAAFVNRALHNPKDVAVADDLAGALTFERFLVGVLTMSRRFKAIESQNVGLLLPASAACDIALLALHMAGKLPVVLNWTTGPGNLAHAASVMKLTHVVTSKAFIDRTSITVAATKYVFLEEVRASIGKLELLRTLLRVRWLPGSVPRLVPQLSPDQPAFVLFTSGSEKAPKAVPLTHRNILSDQQSGVEVMGMTRGDVMLGFLPAFHSFGINVTGLLPLLTGLRVVHHPDPTDAVNLGRKIAAYKVSVLIGTPTFITHILERGKPGDMDSLRLIVIGAEKAPQGLFDLCKQRAPNSVVVEGYGITECAPVVSVNPPPAPKPGSIGKPLPGVEVRVVDLETDEVLPPGKMGMVHVSGPTVFPGYIAYDGDSPFVERDGRRWYVTGDLGEFDEDGYLWFRGRLKRFLKAGGEMISLPALEEPFMKMFPPTEDGPRVAVEGVDHEGKRHIVLFATEPIELHEANARLMAEGFYGVMRLDEVKRVEKIPILGTGKTDYKQLRAEIQASVEA
jgi:long-chain-fatty-acid--[acyl-carrier-protein] ligase